MRRYITKRTFSGIISVILSFCITFFMIRFAPGDPIRMLTGTENPNPGLVQELTVKYGLDKPLAIQFLSYVKNIMSGNFGYSYISDKSVITIVSQRILPTLLLSVTAVVLSVIVGCFWGIIAARKSGSLLDKILCGFAAVFDSVPGFWLGLILILIFASGLKLLPTSGMYDAREQYEGILYVLDVMKHMILPVGTLVIIQSPAYFRVFRTSALETMNEEFVTVFKASGMDNKKIFRKYIFKNSILPIVTMFGGSIAFAISGVTLTETVFSWQGMGRLIIDSIARRDYPVLMGAYLIISICICVAMILTDIVYAMIDPRIKLK